jgi:hypothetical protein
LDRSLLARVNPGTAELLGLTVPQSLLAAAEVID